MLYIDSRNFRAFAFDLDGVVTKTAEVHAAAWKALFDELLARRAGDQSWKPFDGDREYRAYVDGKPRRDGLRSFLAARGITVPEGAPDDGAEVETIYGLAERKNRYLSERLAERGIELYDDAVDLLLQAIAQGSRLAVVTSSQNGPAVLAAARLTDVFDVRVDGNDLERLHLRGKPAPDSFLEAARQLGVEPGRTVVIEDAVAGVQAGRAGGFGLVIGIDRTGHANALREAGAHIVVTSLREIKLVHGDAHAELR